MGSTITGVMGMVGVGMNAYQDQSAAREERRKAELAAREYEAQASLRDTEADELRKLGALDVMEMGVTARAERAATRAGFARSGVKVDSGSAAAAAADQAAWADYERQRREYETSLKAWGLNREAAALRSQAASTRAAGAATSGFTPSSVFSTARTVAGYLTN